MREGWKELKDFNSWREIIQDQERKIQGPRRGHRYIKLTQFQEQSASDLTASPHKS